MDINYFGSRYNQVDNPQKGTGKEGGGSICETGGAFRKKQVAELASLKKCHEDAIDHHSEEVNGLQKEIECHKNKIQKCKNDDD
uniref:Uncharacterized protein n=1 Tax=Gopherus evgoodei TaxID=1825980 RepID=A0A8C4YGV4_9SAUR